MYENKRGLSKKHCANRKTAHRPRLCSGKPSPIQDQDFDRTKRVFQEPPCGSIQLYKARERVATRTGDLGSSGGVRRRGGGWIATQSVGWTWREDVASSLMAARSACLQAETSRQDGEFRQEPEARHLPRRFLTSRLRRKTAKEQQGRVRIDPAQVWGRANAL